jgi:hypothetical protein
MRFSTPHHSLLRKEVGRRGNKKREVRQSRRADEGNSLLVRVICRYLDMHNKLLYR